MTTVTGTCGDCGRPRQPEAIFCECGALLDYSVSGDGRRADEQANGGGTAAAPTETRDHEWPPGPYEQMKEPPAGNAGRSVRVVRCPDEDCRALNPTTFVFCWRCEKPIAPGVEAEQPWRLRRALRLEKEPLRAGKRERPRRPLFGKVGQKTRVALLVVLLLVLLAALVVGAVKAWHPAKAHAAHWYGESREALFPRFKPVYPSVVYAHKQNRRHPATDAFDRNLSTYWLTPTAAQVWDNLWANFPPGADEINEVTVFAGDPTATTIVPEALQLTFYRWEPDPRLHPRECEHARLSGPRDQQKRGAFCVTGIVQLPLVNTPAEQRFSVGTQRDVAKVGITVRGVQGGYSRTGKAALTDVEFFDKH